MGSGTSTSISVGSTNVDPCPLCGATTGTIVWEEHGYAGRGCRCGLVYLDPAPPPDAIDLTVEEHSDEFYRAPARVRVGFVRRVQPTGRFLEVGCGTGCLLEEARHQGYRVEGIEAHAGRARQAADRLGVGITNEFVEDAPPPAEGFDVVYHVDLMSHFPDPERALRAMAAQLGPGGVMCFEAGVLGGMSPAWYRWHAGVGFPAHRFLYSEDALVAMVERAGFEVVRIQRYGLLASHSYTWARRWAARLMRSAQLDPTSDAAAPSTLRRWSDRIEYVLSYHVGRVMPRVGPQAVFIAARPVPLG